MQLHTRRITQTGFATWLACCAEIAAAQGIYSCVDAKGRKITADRPVPECSDRVQKELRPSGSVKRMVAPVPTAQERAAQEEKDKRAAEAAAREVEEKRRDRALLLRYPARDVHDKERANALGQIDEVIKAASKRTTELGEQRKAINTDFEFYKSDPAKAPAPLKRRLEENESSLSVQKRFIAEQEMEKRRVTMRFDEELVKLRQLWTLSGAVAAPKALGSAPAGK
ncbi:MAG TPA: DUF4124 domain-containing protein [Polaromonas sp.]|uniref:DUF4124 domain-containing protein n=1 Tax=Polaromonas sp. TaxID=1869339 RepID=UPI002D6B1033|nr:DUF4124 domain-containing protein [Polaromonas sp.]HYW58628.1 DUF4124 domain-containing protein [Polaromonas sp.]